jgi:hypothetical protein
MASDKKTFSGIMNLDDPRDTLPSTHHKEARNGIFRGNPGMMKFQAIRGNVKVNNTNLKTNDRT